MPQDAVAESLGRLAARIGDPGPLIYARLFARHPGTEALFVMDRAGQVRGQMLATAFEALLQAGQGGHLAGLMVGERMNHVNIGVPAAVFDGFFGLLAETVRELLGPDWTAAMATAWADRIAALAAEAAG